MPDVTAAAALIRNAAANLTAAGLPAERLAALIEHDAARDSHDTYGAHADAAIRRARNAIENRGERLVGVTSRRSGRSVSVTVPADFTARGALVPHPHAELSDRLRRLGLALNDILLGH
jgi:hypothetical protein